MASDTERTPIDAVFPSDKVFLDGLSPEVLALFEIWWRQLEDRNIALGCLYDSPLAQSTGVECWFSYYEDGYTPEDAIAEDYAYV